MILEATSWPSAKWLRLVSLLRVLLPALGDNLLGCSCCLCRVPPTPTSSPLEFSIPCHLENQNALHIQTTTLCEQVGSPSIAQHFYLP